MATQSYDSSVDPDWKALCTELEGAVIAVARKFVRADRPHLSFTEVHDLAQLVDLAQEHLPMDPRLVDFAKQCLAEVAERAARTGFRPKYFDDYRCLESLWEVSVHHRSRPPTVHDGARAV